jgi:hypothetical protein
LQKFLGFPAIYSQVHVVALVAQEAGQGLSEVEIVLSNENTKCGLGHYQDVSP